MDIYVYTYKGLSLVEGAAAPKHSPLIKMYGFRTYNLIIGFIKQHFELKKYTSYNLHLSESKVLKNKNYIKAISRIYST